MPLPAPPGFPTAEPIEHKLLTLKVQTELSFATLLSYANVLCSLRGHRVGTLTCCRALIMPRRILGHSQLVPKMLVLTASRGTPGTPPCGVDSVFERESRLTCTLQTCCLSKPHRSDEEQENVFWDDNPVYIGVHGWQNKARCRSYSPTCAFAKLRYLDELLGRVPLREGSVLRRT